MTAQSNKRRVPVLVLLIVTASFLGGVGLGFVSAADGRVEAATVTAEPRTAGDVSVHTVTATGAFDGNLSKMLVGYGSAGDVDSVTVRRIGVDRGGDGTVDERVPAAIGVRASRVHVVPRKTVALSRGDRIVVRLGGVVNPQTAGRYTARVTVRTTDGAHTAAARYQVTPFAAPGSLVQNVTAPQSTVDTVVARDSTLRDTRIERGGWHDVQFDGVEMQRVHSTTDRLRRVHATDASLRDVRSSRSTYRDVAFTGASLADVRFDRVDATGVAFVGTTVDAVTVTDSTLDRVAVTTEAATDERDALLAVDGRASTSTRAVVEAAEARYDAERTDSTPGANRLADVTVRNSTLRGVTLANTTLENVTFRDVTLENVTLQNVTLRDVTVTDRTFTNGTITDETVTSERRLAYEFRTDDGLDAPVTGDVTVENGTVTASMDGAVESTHTANETGGSGDVSGAALG